MRREWMATMALACLATASSCGLHAQTGPESASAGLVQPRVAAAPPELAAESPTASVVSRLASHWSARPHSEGGLGRLLGRPRSGAEVPLRLRRLLVQGRVAGDMAEMRVEHVFYNRFDERMEGSFRFPLPEGAILTGMAMEVNGKLMEGELVEKDRARQIYQGIVDAMQDPALLEWEQGSTLKLRVFPLEPHQEKRVVLRYLAPLRRQDREWQLNFPTAGLRGSRELDRFVLSFEGHPVVDAHPFTPGEELVVPLPRELVPAPVSSETRRGVRYTSARLRPDWNRLLGKVDVPPFRGPRRLVILLDSSRSALELRPLALETVQEVLRSLTPSDELLLISFDISCRSHASNLQRATPRAIAAAIKLARSTEPDGASDLGVALGCAQRSLVASGGASGAEVLYVGDGVPTWGETDPAKLRELARRTLGSTPFHAVVLGQNANLELMQALVGEAGGRRLSRPHSPRQVQHFAVLLRERGPRLTRVLLHAGDHHQVFPAQPLTLFPDDEGELVALIRTPPGKAPPRRLQLSGLLDGRLITQTFSLESAVPGRELARRWAERRIAQLETQRNSKADVVKLSLEHGVMSRHTSFLVLESEEAYRQYQIERRQASSQPREGPAVTGTDLDSMATAADPSPSSSPRGSFSQDQAMPGDPEVSITAPEGARAVTLVFPTGEVKPCRLDSVTGRWLASFLIPEGTPDGIYTVRVLIALDSGRQLTRLLRYQVDGTSPRVQLQLSTSAVRPGHPVELALRPERLDAAPPPLEGDIGDASFAARVTQDIQRAEALLPDGQTAALQRKPDGTFRLLFAAPEQPGRYELTVVARDHARNKTRQHLWLEVLP